MKRKNKIELVTAGGAPVDGPRHIPVNIAAQEQILFVRLPDSITTAMVLAPIVGALAAKGVQPDEAVQQATGYLEAIFKVFNQGVTSEETVSDPAA